MPFRTLSRISCPYARSRALSPLNFQIKFRRAGWDLARVCLVKRISRERSGAEQNPENPSVRNLVSPYRMCPASFSFSVDPRCRPQGLNPKPRGFLGFAEKTPRGPYIVGQLQCSGLAGLDGAEITLFP